MPKEEIDVWVPETRLGYFKLFLLRSACGSDLRRWEHSTWLPLANHGYWAMIRDQP